MNVEEKIVTTECTLREKQAKLGESLIWSTCIVCIGVGLLVLASGGMFNNQAPDGTTSQIILSDQFIHLIITLSIPFFIGLTAGIILIKSSIKSVAKSYFEAPVANDDCEDI